MTEADFQRTVIETARRLGWQVFHVHDSRRQAGGRMIGDRDAAGFPDLCLVRPPRLLFAELKSDKGRVRPEQKTWLGLLERTGNEVHLWRPRDWPEVVQALQEGE